MTPTQFDRILSSTRINPSKPSATAARLVLIDGLSAQDAAARVGLNRRTVDRIVARLQPRNVCPTCGHATGR